MKNLLKAQWVKFICGASNHDVSLIRNFCYVYTAAGVDCIDISAVVQYSILFFSYMICMDFEPVIYLSDNNIICLGSRSIAGCAGGGRRCAIHD